MDRVLMENRAKDDYIADLRAENYELRQRERAFHALNDRVSDSEHRLHLVKDSRAKLADEMKRTADSDRLCIEGNERDNHELSKALHDKRDEIARLQAELRHLEDVSNGLSCDLDHARSELDAKTGVNHSLGDDLKRLEHTLHDERVTNAGLRNDLDKAQAHLKHLDHEYHHKRDTLHGLEAKQDDLTKTLADRDTEHHGKCRHHDDLDKEIGHLNHVYNATCDENDRLDGQLNRQLGDNDSLMRANIDESKRNDEHNGHMLSLEAQLREKDNHLHVLHKDADGLRGALDRSQVHKDDLSEQLAALNRHVGTLTDQNNRLSAELTDITERDNQIRAALDRRHRIKDLATTNDHQMRESLGQIHDVRSRSPCRRKKNHDHHH